MDADERKCQQEWKRMKPNEVERETQQLINEERKKRGRLPVAWSPYMYCLAKEVAKRHVGKGPNNLKHSNRYALQGGELLCTLSASNVSPKEIVKCWMNSKKHAEWLLDWRVNKAAIGISKGSKWAYVSWSFSERPLGK